MDITEMILETIRFSQIQQRLAWLGDRDAIVSYLAPHGDYLWLEEAQRPGWYWFGWSIGETTSDVKRMSVQEAVADRIQEMISSGLDAEQILEIVSEN